MSFVMRILVIHKEKMWVNYTLFLGFSCFVVKIRDDDCASSQSNALLAR